MSRHAPPGLAELITHAYSAATDRAGWRCFLERFGRVFDGGVVGFLHWERESHNSGISLLLGADTAFTTTYNSYYAARNPWLTHGARFQRSGVVVLSERRYSLPDLLATEFYNDYLRRYDLRHGIGACIVQDEDACLNLTCVRSRRVGMFDERDVRFVRRLMPHLQQALQLHRRLRDAELHTSAALDVLDRLPFGVLLADGRGRVVMANGEARRIAALRDGFTFDRDGVVVSEPGKTVVIRQMLQDASALAAGQHGAAGAPLGVNRPSLRRPFTVLISPLTPRVRPDSVPQACVAVFISDPERLVEASTPALRRLFGLTRAEGALAAALLSGNTVASAAEGLSISRDTARTQLKRVFRKTGARSQAELIRLMLAEPAARRAT